MLKRKPKVLTPEQAEEIRTKDFFDMILPGTVKFLSDHYIVGNSYRCVWAVREYPPSTEEQAILSQLADRNGVTLRIRADVAVDGVTKPIVTQNSTMYHLLADGVDKNLSSSVYDPMTYVGVDQAGTKIHFFVIDGRQDWVSMGVKFYEMVRIAQKFGCWNVTRFDGGGSTTLWLYTDGAGKVVNKPSDSKGERSCMNYMHVRIKQ